MPRNEVNMLGVSIFEGNVDNVELEKDRKMGYNSKGVGMNDSVSEDARISLDTPINEDNNSSHNESGLRTNGSPCFLQTTELRGDIISSDSSSDKGGDILSISTKLDEEIIDLTKEGTMLLYNLTEKRYTIT